MIQIKWLEIKQDVDKQTHRYAKATIADAELKSDAQEDSSVGSQKFIMRWAEEGIAMVTTALREILAASTTVIGTDALEMEKEEWTFTLKNDPGVDERTLAMLIHKMVVEYILFKWCRIWRAGTNESAEWKSAYTDTLGNLVEAAFDLSEPVKHKRPIHEDEYVTEVDYE